MNTILKIKKSKLELLKSLQEIVDEALEFLDIDETVDSNVVEMFDGMRDRKRVKKLKVMSKELNKWIEEWDTENKYPHHD